MARLRRGPLSFEVLGFSANRTPRTGFPYPQMVNTNVVMVTTERVVPMSIHQWVSCGIYPERQKILVAKGTVAPRAAYEPVSAKVVLVDTPGTTSVNPKRFSFKRARPGIWELS